MNCDLYITTNSHANQQQPEHTPATVKYVPWLSQEVASESPHIKKRLYKRNIKTLQGEKTKKHPQGKGEPIHQKQQLLSQKWSCSDYPIPRYSKLPQGAWDLYHLCFLNPHYHKNSVQHSFGIVRFTDHIKFQYTDYRKIHKYKH